jgi:hypothetical protein
MTSKRIASKISNRYTELLDLTTFPLENLYFETNEFEIQQGNKTIKYYKVNIGAKQKGGIGEFVFNLPQFCHSFGVDEFQNEQGKATSHSVSLSMLDKNMTLEEQKEQLNMIEAFGKFIERVKEHLFSIKKEIKKPTLDKSDLKTFNPMHQALDEDGNPKGNAWYFSPKLIERKIYNKEDPSDVQTKMETTFYVDGQEDEKGNPLEISPLEFLGKKHFKFRGAIKVESVYVGAKITLQCKVYDGLVRQVAMERKRLTTSKMSHDEMLLDDE